jgi:peroxiredoxin
MSTPTPAVQLIPHITPLAEGDAAPNFTLKTQDRKDWSLAEAIKQGDVVLAFFPLAFTGVCGTEMQCITKELSAWQKKSGGAAQVVGVSCDSFAALKAWADQMGLKHTLLADMHRDVCKAYGLFWPELNVSKRGTVVIGQDASGQGKVKWIQAREPGKAMDWDEVLAHIA